MEEKNAPTRLGQKKRRRFLIYLLSGTASSVALGLLSPIRGKSNEVDLETLCSLFPYNSRCKNYLPGVRAVDSQGKPLDAALLMTHAVIGNPIPAEGLSKTQILHQEKLI